MSRNKEYYNFYKDKGICTKCNREKAVKGKTMCFDCLEKSKKYSNEYSKKITDEQKARKREWNKRKRDLCVAFKVCTNCMKRDATKGHMCMECWSKLHSKRRNKERINTIAREERKEYNLCYICGKEVLPGKKTCKTCYERTKATMLLNKEKRTCRGFKPMHL